MHLVPTLVPTHPFSPNVNRCWTQGQKKSRVLIWEISHPPPRLPPLRLGFATNRDAGHGAASAADGIIKLSSLWWVTIGGGDGAPPCDIWHSKARTHSATLGEHGGLPVQSANKPAASLQLLQTVVMMIVAGVWTCLRGHRLWTCGAIVALQNQWASCPC